MKDILGRSCNLSPYEKEAKYINRYLDPTGNRVRAMAQYYDRVLLPENHDLTAVPVEICTRKRQNGDRSV